MHISPMIFTPILIASLLLFAYGLRSRLKLAAMGKAEDRSDMMAQRIAMMFNIAFLQKKVLGGSFGLNHFFIFWTFILLALANGEFLVAGVFPALTFKALPQGIFSPLMFVFDVVSTICLIAIASGIIRRIIAPPYKEARTAEAFGILAVIGGLMLAYFGVHAAELALGEIKASMPVSGAIASMLSNMAPASIASFGQTAWWIHAFLILGLMNYLPFGKHMHIITAIPNCLFGAIDKVNTVPREEFAENNSYGVQEANDFTWKDIIDSFTCTECGRCQKVCPATLTDKELVPRTLIEQIKYNLIANQAELKAGKPVSYNLIGDGEKSISKEAIWSCLTCGACMQQCPVLIEHVPKIIKMRRHLVQMESDFPEELLSLFENMEQRSNPWGMAPSDRSKWVGELEVPMFDESKEYLFYVGCSGSFDARARQVTTSMVKILNAAGISYGILGKDELCCGDSVRRLGNEYVFDQMAQQNTDLFKKLGVKKIITACPHCFTTVLNDYKQYGLEIEVTHHTTFINKLIAEKKLALNNTEMKGKNIVYHDSCYLGRHNGIYDAPRNVITSITQKAPIEMEKNRENAFCCGAGGGRMWLEERTEKRVNVERTKQALETNADCITVGCPFCLTMFEDGAKDLGAEVPVKDIAEVVAAAL
ncbi:(Fe-S)-binding protein [Desulfotalea psychrophila]|uniref:Related to iron-sulfur binding reductase n=1 Tax=Desulfotalea psychrophila (strain LSv54 / DSM 12343) TaxID=177439 RepID=Q6AIP9_DESPS|nr:(Fe-S)-binding protein [Desulfotalea psychrophila]CAG37781.1 related to iron-sulfur binding reductase [Desulfotalea psychrophila LSv54]